MSAIVTLTSDFGQRDPSVAEIKGIVFTRSPGSQVADLGHDLARGDVMEASLFVSRAVPSFPAGTVHIVNVAPGPDPIVASILGQYVICPDNGVLTMLSRHNSIDALHTIDIQDVLAAGGQIFFGRSVFAPAAAKLANGAAISELGPVRTQSKRLAVHRPESSDGKVLVGQAIHVDRFGNVVTNVHTSDLAGREVQRIDVSGFPLGPPCRSYSEVEPGQPLALIGGGGYLEVAYRGDRANVRLKIALGHKIKVTLADK